MSGSYDAYRARQPMPTHQEAQAVFWEGARSRPGAGNPYAGRRVLMSAWAAGNRRAQRMAFAEFQRREAERSAERRAE